jgi:hypothetical protein
MLAFHKLPDVSFQSATHRAEGQTEGGGRFAFAVAGVDLDIAFAEGTLFIA